MTLSELIAAYGGQARLAKALGCNKSYVNRAVKKEESGGQIGAAIAVRIYDATSHKLGPIEGASRQQIDAIRQLAVRQAA
jgi:hypothetical protein